MTEQSTNEVLPQPEAPAGASVDFEPVEIDLLLEAIFRRYGFDFRDYARASLRRRIWKRIEEEGLTTVSGLQEKVLHNKACLERLLLDLSITVTSMFRDPSFYLAFRNKVVPMLGTYPTIRIWNAGCSTGEEAYSLAILLAEEGLYERCRIYATDVNEAVLQKAKKGIFPMANMKQNTLNYQQAGGKNTLSSYYQAKYDNAIFSEDVKRNIVFSQHNLATDHSINEFNVILCRNVMIYFNPDLQARVHNLLYESLCMFGFLVLGKKESLTFTAKEDSYEDVDRVERIHRRIA